MNSSFVTVNCPSCKKILQIKHEHPGSTFKCDYCQKYHPVVRENGKILTLTSGISSVEYHATERHENMQCLLEHIERYMPLEKWGFQQSDRFFANDVPQTERYKSENNGYPVIIYNSQKCRAFFTLNYSGSGRSYAAFVYYGRLHAPNEKSIMKWNNEECYCWHNIELPLSFLDGLSPHAAANRGASAWRTLVDSLANSSEFANSGTMLIQHPLKLHSTIWDKYGNTFFDLFDLHNTVLWAQYTQYLKECFDFRGRSVHYTPEFDKVC